MTTQLFAVTSKRGFGRILWAASMLLAAAVNSVPTTDATYDVLQIGTRSYTNVTITTKAKDYVFLMHSTGLMNVKVSELPHEVQVDLGYVKPESANPSPAKSFMSSLGVGTLAGRSAEKTNETVATTSAEAAHKAVVDSPQFKFATTFLQNVHDKVPSASELPVRNMRERCAVAAGGFLAYLFFCYCCAWI